VPRHELSKLEQLAIRRYRAQERERKEREAQLVFKTNDDGLVRTTYGESDSDQQDAGYAEASTSAWAQWVEDRIEAALAAERVKRNETIAKALKEVADTVEAQLGQWEQMLTEILQLKTQLNLLRSNAPSSETAPSDGTTARKFN
jgi:hypothetical protein